MSLLHHRTEETQRRARGRRRTGRAAMQSDRFGATQGNEILTSAAGIALTGLLIAEGGTIVDIGGLVGAHMFIGMALIPPVLLKLASTGYRFIRYYSGSRTYTAKGPPLLALRLLAPALVATTIVVLATGVLLLEKGHNAGSLLEVHKGSFIVWGVLFAVHFLAYARRAARGGLVEWGRARPYVV